MPCEHQRPRRVGARRRSRGCDLSNMRRSGRKTPGRAATSLVSNESYRRAPTNATPAAFIAGAARPPLAILCLSAWSLKLLDTVHRFTGPPRRPPASNNRRRGTRRAPAPCTWRMPARQWGGGAARAPAPPLCPPPPLASKFELRQKLISFRKERKKKERRKRKSDAQSDSRESGILRAIQNHQCS